MRKTTGFILTVMLAGAAWGQTPQFIQKIKDKFKAAPQQQSAAKPAAAQGQAARANTPAKPAVAPVAASAKPAASKPAATSAAANQSAAAKPSVNSSQPVKPAVSSTTATKSAKPAPPPTKIAIAPVAPQPKQGAQKSGPFVPRNMKLGAKAAAPKPVQKPAATSTASATPVQENKEKKIITAEGRRDPFLSPVVNSPTGGSCSTGKRCLAIDQIVVRGVVKADTGMIAVVVNSLNKAYFLKENDPVFNGYVMKITGDSVVFKETYQDKLGKEFTREVVKKITTPAV